MSGIFLTALFQVRIHPLKNSDDPGRCLESSVALDIFPWFIAGFLTGKKRCGDGVSPTR